jgi:hypothetical protein
MGRSSPRFFNQLPAADAGNYEGETMRNIRYHHDADALKRAHALQRQMEDTLHQASGAGKAFALLAEFVEVAPTNNFTRLMELTDNGRDLLAQFGGRA